MTDYGWAYPPGAEHDPAAPYNETDEQEPIMANIEYIVIGKFGGEMHRENIDVPEDATASEIQQLAHDDYTEYVQSGYEPGHYKADSILDAVLHIIIKTGAVNHGQ